MSDRDECIPSPWQELAPFRETFLQHVTEPAAAQALRTLGALFFELVLATDLHWPEPAESPARTDLRAAAADLRYLEGLLRESVVAGLEDCALGAADAALALKAAQWGERLAAVAAEVEVALG